MTKQEQIEAKNNRPIVVGDYVKILIPYKTQTEITEGRGKKKTTRLVEEEAVFSTGGSLEEINGNKFKVHFGSISIPSEITEIYLMVTYDKRIRYGIVDKKYVYRTYLDCGADPFAKEKLRINFYNQDVYSLLFKAGLYKNYNRPDYLDDVDKDGKTYGGINFDPYVIDSNGERQYYQRKLVWSEREKQLLIESIYNGIEIGKFLFRSCNWYRPNDTEAKNESHKYSYDCVDGKQRFFAILEFIQNKYPDMHGNYWNDLSPIAHNSFLSYPNLAYGEMPQSATDSDVIDNFLTLNFSGVKMSEEHINFVKSINI